MIVGRYGGTIKIPYPVSEILSRVGRGDDCLRCGRTHNLWRIRVLVCWNPKVRITSDLVTPPKQLRKLWWQIKTTFMSRGRLGIRKDMHSLNKKRWLLLRFRPKLALILPWLSICWSNRSWGTPRIFLIGRWEANFFLQKLPIALAFFLLIRALRIMK